MPEPGSTIRCQSCNQPIGAVIRRNGIRRFLLALRIVITEDEWGRVKPKIDPYPDRVILAEITGSATIYCWYCGAERRWFAGHEFSDSNIPPYERPSMEDEERFG